VTHIPGVPIIALPGGITVNPGTGEVTVAGPAGSSVTVGGAGGLRVALPPGLASIAGIIGKAVDTVGNILGIGTDPNKTKVDNGDGIWRDLDDPALSTTPGTQTVRVGVTDADGREPKPGNRFSITFTISPPAILRPKILLLLHGMNSNTATWDAFVNTTFGTTATNSVNIRDRAFDPPTQTPTPNALGVLCYRLQFGFFDSVSTRTGLEGVTAANTRVLNPNAPDYLTNPLLKCGDFETFSELGQEIDEAIVLLLARHPNAQIVLLGHSRGGIAARAFLQTPVSTPQKSAVIGLLTTSSPHLGSRMGRIWTWLNTHRRGTPESSNDDWQVVDWLINPVATVYGISIGQAKPPLDVRRPVILDVADDSLALRDLNLQSSVQNLPSNIRYGEILYDAANLGRLSLIPIIYSVFEGSGVGGYAFPQMSNAARISLLDGHAPNWGIYRGDGLIPAQNQEFTFLPGFSGTAIAVRAVLDREVVHTQAPSQIDDLLHQLRLLAPNWFP
jgi:hypothetical protein